MLASPAWPALETRLSELDAMGVDSAQALSDALGARDMGGAKDVARVLNFRLSPAAEKAKDKGLGVEREGLDRARLVNDTIASVERGARTGRRRGTPRRPRTPRRRATPPGAPERSAGPVAGTAPSAEGAVTRDEMQGKGHTARLGRHPTGGRPGAGESGGAGGARRARRRRQGVGRPLPHRERTGAPLSAPERRARQRELLEVSYLIGQLSADVNELARVARFTGRPPEGTAEAQAKRGPARRRGGVDRPGLGLRGADRAVIVKITRGTSVGGLVRYLFGPGRANEHYAQHVVAGAASTAPRSADSSTRPRCASSPGSSTASAPSSTSRPAPR